LYSQIFAILLTITYSSYSLPESKEYNSLS